MNRLYKVGVFGLVVILLYTEWRFAFRSWEMASVVLGDLGIMFRLQFAVIKNMLINPLVWLCAIPVVIKLAKGSGKGSDKGQLYKRYSR